MSAVVRARRPMQISPMATWDELPLKYRLTIRAYRWRRIAPTPWAAPRVPLAQARVALVTSAGLYRPGVDRDFGTREGEDITARLLPADVPLATLAVGQTSDAFDRTALEADRNLALPLDRLRELRDAGVVGDVAPRAVSFNGSLLAPGRFLRDTAPGIVDALRADQVDAALFVPV
jgi:D-proline reductase (dithiol) PrdB